eukprot:397054-Pyramimonas_sp.AAC.1
MVSFKNLRCDNIPIWCSANDVIVTSGRNGRNPPNHSGQLIGILLKTIQCRRDRGGLVWLNALCIEDNQRGNLHANTYLAQSYYHVPYDASALNNWMIPQTHHNLK